MGESLRLSTLPKTWIFDLDGTLLKHNGYKTDGEDVFLSGAKAYLASIPENDKIVILTSRTKEYKQQTEEFLLKNGIRFDEILFEMPMGERILVNDRKPSGLDMAIAINLNRDEFIMPTIICEK